MDLGAGIDKALAPSTGSDDATVLFAPFATVVWQTASGRHIPHTVYSLIGCPAVQAATYLLVRRAADGQRTVLAVARTRTKVATLNLASIRNRGASLGANEVHVHAAGASDGARAEIELDLALALLG